MGATSGLGRSLAEKYIKAGWTVGAAGRNIHSLESLQAMAPNRVKIAAIDILQPEASHKLMSLIDECGGIDTYLHCSGIALLNEEYCLENEVRIAETNAVGFTRMVSAAFGWFAKSRHKGRIVAISSIAGVRGLEALPAYSASKSFDSVLLEALRQRADGLRLPLRIVDIKPGWTRTPLLNEGKRYMWEMEADKVAEMIFRASQKAHRSVTIGWRWKFLTSIERIIPSIIWRKIHIPLWK